jgi:hypothetical protein
MGPLAASMKLKPRQARWISATPKNGETPGATAPTTRSMAEAVVVAVEQVHVVPLVGTHILPSPACFGRH